MAPATRGWALVTGAARRIGQALAVRAAAAGYDVIAHVRHSADGEETAAQIRAKGVRAEVAAADLEEPTAADRLIVPRDAPLTLLVNCASVFGDDRPASATAADLDHAFRTNTRAPILLAQAFARAADPTVDNLVVNILDQRVLRLDPRFFSYSVSRSTLWGATQMMAQAFAPQVRVNAIGPGPTLPSPHQSPEDFAAEVAGVLLRRQVEPEEIALALDYLIHARAVTGQIIAVDSGQHLGWRTPDVVGG